MKTIKIAFAISLMALSSTLVQAQSKEPVQPTPAVQNDSLIVLSMKDFQEYASAINRNVDSKTATRELITFLEQRLTLIPKQPANKAKEPEQPKKKE